MLRKVLGPKPGARALPWRLGVCTFVVTVVAATVARAEEPRVYVVGPSDVLVVTVYNQPQLTGKYTVEADGMFTFPLLGRVKAGGLTLRALEDSLRDGLSRGYLKDPQVGIVVDQYRSQQVFVMGEVREPGAVPLTGPMTLIEALARAGSTTDRAASEVLIVRSAGSAGPADASALSREQLKGSDVTRVDLQELQGGVLSHNVALWPGDTIVVPRAEPVVVTGQVRNPGEYVLRRPMTVRQVLALAGGVTDRGSTRRIQILRQVKGLEITLDADLGDPVQPGDTIVVRERLF